MWDGASKNGWVNRTDLLPTKWIKSTARGWFFCPASLHFSITVDFLTDDERNEWMFSSQKYHLIAWVACEEPRFWGHFNPSFSWFSYKKSQTNIYKFFTRLEKMSFRIHQLIIYSKPLRENPRVCCDLTLRHQTFTHTLPTRRHPEKSENQHSGCTRSLRHAVQASTSLQSVSKVCSVHIVISSHISTHQFPFLRHIKHRERFVVQ